ncbi:MAG: hypothetical protein U0414_44445 [Polyangiaceae bacterium]
MRKGSLGPLAAVVLGVLGCGNEVITEGTGGSSSTSKSSAYATTGSASPTVGSTGVTSSSSGKPPVCAGLGETQCLAAFPECAPVYDDFCCPTCTPGPCADCVNMQFYECQPAASVCSGAPLSCGVVSKENCAGLPATCESAYCPANAGCVQVCEPDANGQCMAGPCHPVTAGSCTSVCDGIPPNCPPGFVPEQDGTCYTGFCIPDQVCSG